MECLQSVTPIQVFDFFAPILPSAHNQDGPLTSSHSTAVVRTLDRSDGCGIRRIRLAFRREALNELLIKDNDERAC